MIDNSVGGKARRREDTGHGGHGVEETLVLTEPGWDQNRSDCKCPGTARVASPHHLPARNRAMEETGFVVSQAVSYHDPGYILDPFPRGRMCEKVELHTAAAPARSTFQLGVVPAVSCCFHDCFSHSSRCLPTSHTSCCHFLPPILAGTRDRLMTTPHYQRVPT